VEFWNSGLESLRLQTVMPACPQGTKSSIAIPQHLAASSWQKAAIHWPHILALRPSLMFGWSVNLKTEVVLLMSAYQRVFMCES